ncbi:DUF1523 family protein [Marinibacterium profundimaris]|uniref:DUF1523 domain-containing protein n=1 Tax=Marinibacterium profundimaris TaxID=1679460 RepID=A0A225NNG4_9RHOB|nr:DUF1523 family protein [Marinibacterium profundimaris]OWU75975.1 hypothetical protein ATO3_07315 [Marinibacterium profundimaris]
MTYIKWAIIIVFWGLIASVLFYTLPRHDVVRIVSTDVRRVDFGDNSIFWSNAGVGEAEGTASRDVFFISAVRPNGKTRVYRNEDTGWIWPPYFKLNSSNVQAEASDLQSNSADPRWVSVRYYGWRVEIFSIYPNAVSMKAVDSPDYKVVNYFNIIFLAGLAILAYVIHRRFKRFREKRFDPLIEDVTDRFEAASDERAGRTGRFRRWLADWKQT